MLEGIFEKVKQCKFRQLEEHFINEDLDKEILALAVDKSTLEQEQRRKFLNDRIAQRKNLYIYPEHVNV